MNDLPRILVVEDKCNEREALARMLRLQNYEVVIAEEASQALTLAQDSIDLVIGDLRIGKCNGLDLLRHWKGAHPETSFIIVTAHGSVDSAVEAMKLGAEDYLSKPVDPEELSVLVKKIVELRRKDETLADLHEQLQQRQGLMHIIGESAPMLEVFEKTRRAALSESTVLITGESGTGKELIAQAIHENSPRQGKEFVTVNMAAVPEHLAESELFGHTKGSFTGATDSRVGRFEAASGGTIFIDEIGDFKRECQAKLLRVLENRTVTPIGSNDDREVDVRVVAATSRNLDVMVAEGEFREDLYYRLNVVNLQLPPLRERKEDIPLLVAHFLDQICRHVGKSVPELAPDLEHFLLHHHWPGNVRQLRNCLESMVILSQGSTLTLANLPKSIEQSPVPSRRQETYAAKTLFALEREAVEQELKRQRGNRTRAAKSLGISVRTLQRKLKAWRSNGQQVPEECVAPSGVAR